MKLSAANDNWIDISNNDEAVEAFYFWHELTNDPTLATRLAIIEAIKKNPSSQEKALLNSTINTYMPFEAKV